MLVLEIKLILFHLFANYGNIPNVWFSFLSIYIFISFNQKKYT